MEYIQLKLTFVVTRFALPPQKKMYSIDLLNQIAYNPFYKVQLQLPIEGKRMTSVPKCNLDLPFLLSIIRIRQITIVNYLFDKLLLDFSGSLVSNNSCPNSLYLLKKYRTAFSRSLCFIMTRPE